LHIQVLPQECTIPIYVIELQVIVRQDGAKIRGLVVTWKDDAIVAVTRAWEIPLLESGQTTPPALLNELNAEIRSEVH
jgi:hypothetical protein